MITLNKEDAFTIVDIISKAQEIVRCKDCKYSSSNGLYGCYLEHFELAKDHMGRLIPNNGARMYAEDFCSRGVRRGEEDEID